MRVSNHSNILLVHTAQGYAISPDFWISNLNCAEAKLVQALEGKKVLLCVVQTIVLIIYLSV